MLIFILEVLSFLIFLEPQLRSLVVFCISFLFLFLSLKDLKYGIAIILLELLIGSKGYLFYLEYDDTVVSIRIIFWLILMSVWIGGVLRELMQKFNFLQFKYFILNRENYSLKNRFLKIIKFFKKVKGLEFFSARLFFIFLIFFIFLFFSLILAFLNKNGFNNIFLDFNNWLYFVLIFPIYKKTKNISFEEFFCLLKLVFFSGLVWLVLKTFILLFLFSHSDPDVLYLIYRWIRNTGVGEIVQIQGGFYRIFFQSHIFSLLGFFILLFSLNFSPKKYCIKKNIFKLIILGFLFAIILISFSRSFWIGFLVGLILYEIFLLFYLKWRKILILNLNLVLVVVLSFLLIVVTVKFPYPKPLGGFETSELFSKRAKAIKNESAVSSRWNLLPEIIKGIKKSPVWGYGFGKTVTYRSSDPRIVESSVDGEYTTYAFEWGFLDIWLKLGFFGLCAYLFLIINILFPDLKKFRVIKSNILDNLKNLQNTEELIFTKIYLGLIVSVIVLLVVHFFTPFLNHPLGIGYLLLVYVIVLLISENFSLDQKR